MIRKFLLAAGVIAVLGIAYACSSDKILAPSGQFSRGSALPANADLSDPDIDTVITLQRAVYLPEDVSESAVIDPDGGEIGIAASGATIVFPPGALSKRTRITMTAKAGWNVAYEFSPHGIEFAQPVVVQQDLSYTLAYRMKDAATVQAGYFRKSLDSIFLDSRKSVARVSELRNVELDPALNPRVAKFFIYHFSGYILSSGFAGGSGDTGDGDVQP
jgi:hypothetical protein